MGEPLSPTEIGFIVFASLVVVFCIISCVAFALREGPVVPVIHPELAVVSIREVDPDSWVSRQEPYQLTKDGVIRVSDGKLMRAGRFQCFDVATTGVPAVFTNVEYPGAISIRALSRDKVAVTYEDRIEVQDHTFPRGPMEWIDSSHIGIIVKGDVDTYDVTTGRRTSIKVIPRPSPVSIKRDGDHLVVHCGRPDWFTAVPRGYEVAYKII